MIKFTALIHKETGIVIKYEVWKERLETDNIIKWKDKKMNGTWQYKPKNMLFSDDFEIIYNSELSNLELISLYDGCPTAKTLVNLKYAIEQNHIKKRLYGIDI